jgi:transmembrane sensor
MNASQQRKREFIASQAGEWVAAHTAGPLSAAERRAFYEWLTASPTHIEEYLGVALISRHLSVAADDPDTPLESVLERVRKETDNVAPFTGALSSPQVAVRVRPQPLKLIASAAAAAVICLGVFWWNASRVHSQQYATHHGELRTWRLGDDSLLKLNTDSSVTVRYSRSERRIDLNRGEALFEVVPRPTRPFRVVAGTTNVMAVGTAFAVRQERSSTLITVVRGRVSVWTTDSRGPPVQVNEGYAVRVLTGQPPGPVAPADLSHATAWLHRQIIFQTESLAAVAAEFNRYSAVSIEIETPALRSLPVSGVFSVDDTQTFLDFLRSLEGVSVASTSTRIRVYQSAAPSPVSPPGRH